MDKEIRFNQKKVDESWKDTIAKEKSTAKEPPAAPKNIQVHPIFVNFIRSLGMQAMMFMGLLEEQSGAGQVNMEAAQEMIDILVAIKEKTAGNLAPQEDKLLTSLIADLQLKYVEQAK